MIKSKKQKIIDVVLQNKTVYRLFEEFEIDLDYSISGLVDVLLENDELIQEKTVLSLAENPEKSGRKEKLRIRVDESGSNLGGKYFWLFWPGVDYYVWYNTGSSTNPFPAQQSTNPIVGIEVTINLEDAAPVVASKTIAAISGTGSFDATISNNYSTVIASTEITAITFTDDTENANSNYSSKFFDIFSETTKYSIWFDIEDTSDAPTSDGILVKVMINASDSLPDIISKAATIIGSLPVFNASSNGINVVEIETTNAGEHNDAISHDPRLDVTIISQGNNTYTQAVSDITLTSSKEGAVQMSRNSMASSPDFEFTRIQLGTDDLIAALNQKVSIALELFPQRIASPHESNYRSFISESKTRYIYFLKWIYYTYKYFNEEQFFFHNMIEHFIPDYDAGIISSTNNLKIYFDGLGIILDTLDQKIGDLYKLGDIDEVDEKFLQHIAQLLGYQREDFSIKNLSFREMIKNLVEIYQRKGSSYSFGLFFKLLGFQADLREYYWDRDSKNPEKFASITPYDYLYYLTIQDPRTRTEAQIEDMRETYPIQPVGTRDFVLPKDLRDFTELQQDYSIDEILGFRGSALNPEDRFTYFKTNFINFKLTQFYTKQDLTAKDTDTILKYVKFLTPIYVSAFVEVVTTPWQDTFEMSNPLADEEVLEGDPGTPNWIDILLPFLYVTLKEYIPLNLDPAPESAVVLVQHASTDDTGDGFADSALPYIFGDPNHGITVEGEVQMIGGATADLSTNKYMNIKLDKGRGQKIIIQGNTVQTFAQLVTRINQRFTALEINATALSWGISPNLDIRIRSNTQGSNSKIYLAGGLVDDIFTNLHTTTDPAISGSTGVSGYQEFGLAIADMNDATNLDPGKSYIFYVNVDDDNFLEIDVSGPTSTNTSLTDIINSINNHYVEVYSTDFIGSAQVQNLNVLLLKSGKIATLFRDSSTNNGKLVILNRNGTFYRSGINFYLFDCDTISATTVEEPDTRFFLSYRDRNTDQLRWTIINNEGDKEFNDQILENNTNIICSKAIALDNNRVFFVYSNSTEVFVRQFELVGPSEVGTPMQIHGSPFNSIDACLKEDGGVVVSGTISQGGVLIYLKEDGSWAINDTEADSVKVYASGANITKVNLTNMNNGKIMVAYRGNTTAPPEDHKVYFNIWGDGILNGPEEELANPIVAVDYSVESFQANLTLNENILFTYVKAGSGEILQQVYNSLGQTIKKEITIFDSDEASEVKTVLMANGDSVNCFAAPNKGRYLLTEYMGSVANSTFDSRLRLESIAAGETWDDTVENYAETSDQGHLFTMDDSEYIFDNYSSHYRSLGADFTDERNRFNTFYQTSPNDDLVDLVQDTLTFLFTLLVGADDYPADTVDKFGFYPNRAGIFSRSINPEVGGNDFMAHFVKHLDLSDPVRNSDNRIVKELLWPLWKKDKFDNSLEKTTIAFLDDTDNLNSNIDGQHFTILNGHTKMVIWYYKDSSTLEPEEDGLLLRVRIENLDSAEIVATKTRNRINSHLSNSFSVARDQNTITITAQKPGNNQNASSSSPGYIQITDIKNGSIANEYENYSSWTMALDYFRPYIGWPPVMSTAKIKMGGSAYPAGIYRSFVYGVPRGTTGGAYLIEGDPTGTAIIEFIINDPDPSKKWPVSASVSYIEETTGTWQSVPISEISLDGKTIRATVDHFSVWGVIDSTTGELISDDFDSGINVLDANIVRIDEILHGPQGLGQFGGTAQYGPYEDFEAPEPTGGIVAHGVANYSFGYRFFFTASGRIFLEGAAEAEVGADFTYVPTGVATTSISHSARIDEILVTADFGAIVSGGEAIARFADYFFDAEGGITLNSATEYSHTRKWSYDYQIFGFIQMAGSAPSALEREYEIEMSGSIVSNISHIFRADLEYEMTNGMYLSGEVEHTFIIESIASGFLETNISSIQKVDLFSTTYYGSIAITGAAESSSISDFLPAGGITTHITSIYSLEVYIESKDSVRTMIISDPESEDYNGEDWQFDDLAIQGPRTLSLTPIVLKSNNSFSPFILAVKNNNSKLLASTLWPYTWIIWDNFYQGYVKSFNVTETDYINNIDVFDISFSFQDKILFVGEEMSISSYDDGLQEWSFWDGTGAGSFPTNYSALGDSIEKIEYNDDRESCIFITSSGGIGNINLYSEVITFPDGTTSGGIAEMPYYSSGYSQYSSKLEQKINDVYFIRGNDNVEAVFCSSEFVFTYNYIEETFYFPDTIENEKIAFQEQSLGEIYKTIDIDYENIVFLSEGGVFNFNRQNGITLPNGLKDDGITLGVEPFFDSTKTTEDLTVTSLGKYKNQIIIAMYDNTNSISIISSYSYSNGWSIPGVVSSQFGIAKDYFSTKKITHIADINPIDLENYKDITILIDEEGDVGYIKSYNAIAPYNEREGYAYTSLFDPYIDFFDEKNIFGDIELSRSMSGGIHVTQTVDYTHKIGVVYVGVSEPPGALYFYTLNFDDNVKIDLEESTLEFGSVDITGSALTKVDVIHIAEGIAITQSSAHFEIGYISTLDVDAITVSGSADDDFEKIAILDFGRIEISGENEEDDLELIFLTDGGVSASGSGEIGELDLEESTLDFGSILASGESEIDFELEGQLEYGQVNIAGSLNEIAVETDDFIWLVFVSDGRIETSIGGESTVAFERNFIGGVAVSGTNEVDIADLEESTLDFGSILISGSPEIVVDDLIASLSFGSITTSGTNEVDLLDIEILTSGSITTSGTNEVDIADLEESTLDFGSITTSGTNEVDIADLEESTLSFGSVTVLGSSSYEVGV